MSGAALDFGSLNDHLRQANPYDNLNRSIELDGDFASQFPDVSKAAAASPRSGTIDLMRSAGPVSDAFIVNALPISCISGPQGSGKTIAGQKKFLIESQRVRPGADGVRRYKLGVFRQLYDALWKATIPSWWKIFPKDLPGSSWTGASPRAARHVIRYEDRWGMVEAVADFLAFGDDADPENLRGLEFTDVELPEVDTLPEDLIKWLVGRIGRDPPPEVIGRMGRIWCDMNAPDILNWAYRFFYERHPEWLFRQPGGLSAGAENLQALGGRAHYEQQAALNADNPWWVRRMVHAIPGMSRATDLVYDKFDEQTMRSPEEISVEPVLPVLVGCDGGLTPAAVYGQEMPDGQLRILAEIALERGGAADLGRAMLALEARRFKGCEFSTECDPSMKAGEDDGSGRRSTKRSDREELADALGREVRLASTNEPTRRWASIRDKISLYLGPSRPGLLVDPSCLGLIRGFLQTYAFRKIKGTNDLSSVQSSFDTHVHDGLQIVGLQCGTEAARKRKTDVEQQRHQRRAEARRQGRYNPNSQARRRAGR